MELLFVVLLIILWVCIRKFKGNEYPEKIVKNCLAPMPKGYQIYFRNLEIDRVGLYRDAALIFCRGRKPFLSWEREPDNKFDKNAIKLIGNSEKYGLTSNHIGYIPRELAETIHEAGLFKVMRPRLERIYVGDYGYGWIGIRYQLIGPKEHKCKWEGTHSD